MKAGVLMNSNNRLTSYSEKFLKILNDSNVPNRLIDPSSRTLLSDLKECSHLIFHHSQGDTDLRIYETIYNIANKVFGIKCMPEFDAFWQYEDKIKEYYLLKSYDFPIVDSWVFWNCEQADSFLDEASYPIVAKLPKGAASSNVVLVNSPQEGRTIDKQVFTRGVKDGNLNHKSSLSSLWKAGMFNYTRKSLRSLLINSGFMRDKSKYPEWQIQKDAILYQKYLPNNSFDHRITIIGNRAFGARRFVRKNDFRASGSGNCDLDPKNIDLRCVEIAVSISKKFNFSTMAYDFIYDEDKKPKINEFGYCFPDHAVHDCPGYWDDQMVWHQETNWPQYYQLLDFLKIDLKNTLE